LPNCEGCVKFFAPNEAGGRIAIDYSKPPSSGEERLDSGQEDLGTIEGMQKEDGFCHIAGFPLGLNGSYALWEDDKKLGPEKTLHDDIRTLGKGRHDIGSKWVYFST